MYVCMYVCMYVRMCVCVYEIGTNKMHTFYINYLIQLYCLRHNNNNNIYLLQLGCYPVAVVILHVNET